MDIEKHEEEEGGTQRNYGCGATSVLKEQMSGFVSKAKEALQVKTKLKKKSPTEYCGQDNLTPATPSNVPILPVLQSNLANMQLSSMHLRSDSAHDTSGAGGTPSERANSPATSYATAQAFVNHTPTASDATAHGLSGIAERDASGSDYHEAEEANDLQGDALKTSDQNLAVTRGPGNFMTRYGSESGNGNLPIRTVNGIYVGMGFDKSLPELPDPFLPDAADQTNVDSNAIPSSGSSSEAGNTIDPFYASGPRVVLHSPYGMGNYNGNQERSIFSKQALIDMDHHTHHVEIDLFSPLGIMAAFPVTDLKPLWRLKELRSLKIVGMQQSYQTFIWEVVWKNPHMERVTMEMAEAPSLSQRVKDLGWHVIHGSDWAPRKLCEVTAKYRGDSNNLGRLHERNGSGEYLDVKAIIEAKNYVKHAVERELPNYNMPAKLQVKELRLSGFVVDAFVFRTCFDEDVLESIHFGWDCVDGGFALSSKMLENVEIRIPQTGRKL